MDSIPVYSGLNRNESGRIGALKSDSTHHFFRNTCTKSGSLRSVQTWVNRNTVHSDLNFKSPVFSLIIFVKNHWINRTLHIPNSGLDLRSHYTNYCYNLKYLYQVRVITVFAVFRLTDFVCLYSYEFWLSLCKIVRWFCCCPYSVYHNDTAQQIFKHL
jgi:hypothetical protein